MSKYLIVKQSDTHYQIVQQIEYKNLFYEVVVPDAGSEATAEAIVEMLNYNAARDEPSVGEDRSSSYFTTDVPQVLKSAEGMAERIKQMFDIPDRGKIIKEELITLAVKYYEAGDSITGQSIDHIIRDLNKGYIPKPE